MALSEKEAKIIEAIKEAKRSNREMAREFHVSFRDLKRLRAVAEGHPPSAVAVKETSRGEIASRVFAHFKNEMPVQDVVISEKLEPQVVSELYKQYCDLNNHETGHCLSDIGQGYETGKEAAKEELLGPKFLAFYEFAKKRGYAGSERECIEDITVEAVKNRGLEFK